MTDLKRMLGWFGLWVAVTLTAFFLYIAQGL
jgi:hypothetical protein